ncbi:MAG: bifunctional ADP-dependent NAD(P)H-hydrate dehydratase/NAD(P)H-hydrate epimerase, partial [Actinomycetota bacterium]|nr:bifunctional ADP-dependent NAD(P)H-hydrate dehydratase/NAD(P)H-hydrate epimerase [Actinomycetota bacterium]
MEPQGAWRVERVRAAEDVVLARTGEGALMRRAAYGLARVATQILRERTGGVTGRWVGLLVG